MKSLAQCAEEPTHSLRNNEDFISRNDPGVHRAGVLSLLGTSCLLRVLVTFLSLEGPNLCPHRNIRH
jgi:hypothetical protein